VLGLLQQRLQRRPVKPAKKRAPAARRPSVTRDRLSQPRM